MKNVPVALKKRTFISSTGYDFTAGHAMEHTNPVSAVVPNQSYSIPQAIEKLRRGLAVPKTQPVYSPVEVMDFRRLDIVELEQFRDSMDARSFDLRKAEQELVIKKQEAALAKKKADDEALNSRIKDVTLQNERKS